MVIFKKKCNFARDRFDNCIAFLMHGVPLTLDLWKRHERERQESYFE